MFIQMASCYRIHSFSLSCVRYTNILELSRRNEFPRRRQINSSWKYYSGHTNSARMSRKQECAIKVTVENFPCTIMFWFTFSSATTLNTSTSICHIWNHINSISSVELIESHISVVKSWKRDQNLYFLSIKIRVWSSSIWNQRKHENTRSFIERWIVQALFHCTNSIVFGVSASS